MRTAPTATGPWYVQLANGIGSTRVIGTPYVPRSRSHETTFQHDLADWSQVLDEIRVLARRVATTAAEEERLVARVAVKVRFSPFFTHTRSRTLVAPTAGAAEIEDAALEVVELFEHDRPIRLLGVRAEFVRDPP